MPAPNANQTITVAALNAMLRDRWSKILVLSSNERIKAADTPVLIAAFVAPPAGLAIVSVMFRAFPARGIPITNADTWKAVLLVDGVQVATLAVDPKTLTPYKPLAFSLPPDMAPVPPGSVVEVGLTTDGAPVAIDCPSFTLTAIDA